MKIITTTVAAIGALMLLTAPAHAGKFRIDIDYKSETGDTISTGSVLISDDVIRSYASHPRDFNGLEVDDEGKIIRRTDGSISSSSSDQAVAMILSDAAEASGGATGTNGNRATPVNMNSEKEIFYNIAENTQYTINHVYRNVKIENTVFTIGNPADMILGGATKSVSKNDGLALRGMLGMLTKPRLDPKDEIKLEDTDLSDQVELNNALIKCRWKIMNRMGGPIGRVCVANPKDVADGTELMATIRALPLEGAGGKVGPVGCARQIAETGKLPVKVEEFGPEPYDDGSPGYDPDKRDVEYRYEVTDILVMSEQDVLYGPLNDPALDEYETKDNRR